jgi:signal transduction histidine kinase
LNNAVRHSGATQVLIEMAVVGKKLKIAAVDNGRGFNPNASVPGNDGLAGMQERMARLGGGCEIKSELAKGTTVEFWLPLGGPEI